MRKATFCQSEGNFQQALALWRRAVKIAPLDHVGGFNFLLCRRTLEPQQGYMRESLDLAKEAVLLPYLTAPF